MHENDKNDIDYLMGLLPGADPDSAEKIQEKIKQLRAGKDFTDPTGANLPVKHVASDDERNELEKCEAALEEHRALIRNLRGLLRMSFDRFGLKFAPELTLERALQRLLGAIETPEVRERAEATVEEALDAAEVVEAPVSPDEVEEEEVFDPQTAKKPALLKYAAKRGWKPKVTSTVDALRAMVIEKMG